MIFVHVHCRRQVVSWSNWAVILAFGPRRKQRARRYCEHKRVSWLRWSKDCTPPRIEPGHVFPEFDERRWRPTVAWLGCNFLVQQWSAHLLDVDKTMQRTISLINFTCIRLIQKANQPVRLPEIDYFIDTFLQFHSRWRVELGRVFLLSRRCLQHRCTREQRGPFGPRGLLSRLNFW